MKIKEDRYSYNPTSTMSTVNPGLVSQLDSIRTRKDTEVRGGLQIVKSLDKVDPKTCKVGMIVIIDDGDKYPWYQLRKDLTTGALYWELKSSKNCHNPIIVPADQIFECTNSRDLFFFSHESRLDPCSTDYHPYCIVDDKLQIYDPTLYQWTNGVPYVKGDTTKAYKLSSGSLPKVVGQVSEINLVDLQTLDTKEVPRTATVGELVIGPLSLAYISGYKNSEVVYVTTVMVPVSSNHGTGSSNILKLSDGYVEETKVGESILIEASQISSTDGTLVTPQLGDLLIDDRVIGYYTGVTSGSQYEFLIIHSNQPTSRQSVSISTLSGSLLPSVVGGEMTTSIYSLSPTDGSSSTLDRFEVGDLVIDQNSSIAVIKSIDRDNMKVVIKVKSVARSQFNPKADLVLVSVLNTSDITVDPDYTRIHLNTPESQVIDGVQLKDGDRVLIAKESSLYPQGVYEYSDNLGGSPTLTIDRFYKNLDKYTVITILSGTMYTGSQWKLVEGVTTPSITKPQKIEIITSRIINGNSW